MDFFLQYPFSNRSAVIDPLNFFFLLIPCAPEKLACSYASLMENANLDLVVNPPRPLSTITRPSRSRTSICRQLKDKERSFFRFPLMKEGGGGPPKGEFSFNFLPLTFSSFPFHSIAQIKESSPRLLTPFPSERHPPPPLHKFVNRLRPPLLKRRRFRQRLNSFARFL